MPVSITLFLMVGGNPQGVPPHNRPSDTLSLGCRHDCSGGLQRFPQMAPPAGLPWPGPHRRVFPKGVIPRDLHMRPKTLPSVMGPSH